MQNLFDKIWKHTWEKWKLWYSIFHSGSTKTYVKIDILFESVHKNMVIKKKIWLNIIIWVNCACRKKKKKNRIILAFIDCLLPKKGKKVSGFALSSLLSQIPRKFEFICFGRQVWRATNIFPRSNTKMCRKIDRLDRRRKIMTKNGSLNKIRAWFKSTLPLNSSQTFRHEAREDIIYFS